MSLRELTVEADRLSKLVLRRALAYGRAVRRDDPEAIDRAREALRRAAVFYQWEVDGLGMKRRRKRSTP
jgi:hypothetical protein